MGTEGQQSLSYHVQRDELGGWGVSEGSDCDVESHHVQGDEISATTQRAVLETGTPAAKFIIENFPEDAAALRE